MRKMRFERLLKITKAIKERTLREVIEVIEEGTV